MHMCIHGVCVVCVCTQYIHLYLKSLRPWKASVLWALKHAKSLFLEKHSVYSHNFKVAKEKVTDDTTQNILYRNLIVAQVTRRPYLPQGLQQIHLSTCT